MLSQLRRQPAAVSLRLPVQAIRLPARSSTMPAFSWKRAPSGVGRRRVGRGEGQVGEAPPDLFAERFAALDGLDLARTERAPDDEAHPPAVSHQALDPAGREGEGAGVEVPGQPVVALRVFKRGDVEEPDEVAVLGGVLEPPGMVGEHERLPCPERRRGPGAPGAAAERRFSRAARARPRPAGRRTRGAPGFAGPFAARLARRRDPPAASLRRRGATRERRCS